MTKKKNDRSRNFLRYLLTPSSPFPVQEAYKSLRTNVAFSIPGGDAKCIAITSANRGEGKSSVAVNLAISFAQIGRKVVLIDCDLRLPTIAQKIGMKKGVGLSEFLIGENTVSDCIYKVSNLGFSVITSGSIPPDPTALLESKEMSDLIEVLRNYYDYIIIDCPPALAVPDAMIMSKYVDGFFFVVRHDSTTYKNVADAVKALEFANAKMLGFVYNDKPVGTHSVKYYSKY